MKPDLRAVRRSLARRLERIEGIREWIERSYDEDGLPGPFGVVLCLLLLAVLTSALIGSLFVSIGAGGILALDHLGGVFHRIGLRDPVEEWAALGGVAGGLFGFLKSLRWLRFLK